VIALLALLGLGPLAATAARTPGEPADPDRRAADEARGIERDNPAERIDAARELLEGQPGPQALEHRLEVARGERARAVYRGDLQRSGAAFRNALTLAPVPDGVWLNLGPTHADSEWNSATFHNVDSGRVRGIVPHPTDPKILFLATAGGGVWKTYNGGGDWEPLTDFLGATAVGALAMDPHNPDILYLGLGDPFDTTAVGLAVTTDGGATFSDPLKAVAVATYGSARYTATSVRDIKVDPGNSAHVLVATDIGLFSWDGSHAPVHLPLPDRAGAQGSGFQIWSIGWVGANTWLVSGRAPGASSALSGGTANPLVNLWRSTDNGVTWTTAIGGLPAADAKDIGRATIAVAESTTVDAESARVYLLAANSNDSSGTSAQRDLYRSEDGGKTFQPLLMSSRRVPVNPTSEQPDLNVLHEQAWYDQAIAVDPTNPDLVLVGGNLSMVRSTDGGQTWAVMADWLPAANNLNLPYVHADYHAMAFSLANVKTFYVGTDGGLFSSTDVTTALPGRATLSDALNTGIVSHLVYSLACAPDSWPAAMQGFVIGGFQDNGTRLRSLASQSGPSTFDQVFGGDGIGVAVSGAVGTDSPNATLTSVPKEVYRSLGGGAIASWQKFMDGLGSPMPFFVRFASEGDQTFLTFTDAPDSSVYRSVGGGSWAKLPSHVHYAGAPDADQFLTYAQKPAAFHFISTHPAKAGVYAINAAAGAVYVTPNGGTDWYASSVLGTGPSRKLGIKGTAGLSFDPSDTTASTLWVGSQANTVFDIASDPANPITQPVPDDYGHLFKTTDLGQSWTSVLGSPGHSLPNVEVVAVKVDPNDPKTVYVGTFIGLYITHDGGNTFDRAPGLPLVQVSDICVSPASRSMKIATYGRGFWQLNNTAGGLPAGARGRGDLDFNQQLDGFDLIDLVSRMGADNTSPRYSPEADLVGTTNTIDDGDLAAFVARFGGSP
jgi:photosystem II stability/assembly factor-like uncharacterized protein